MAEEDAEVEVQPTTGVGKFLFGSVEDVALTYNGEWKILEDGTKVRHGKGTQSGAESYDGSWKDDKMHGEGKYTFSTGATYTGSFVEDRFQGKGTYVWADGSKYDGNWEDNRMSGKGSYVSASGVVYTGTFFNDKFKDSGNCYRNVTELE